MRFEDVVDRGIKSGENVVVFFNDGKWIKGIFGGFSGGKMLVGSGKSDAAKIDISEVKDMKRILSFGQRWWMEWNDKDIKKLL